MSNNVVNPCAESSTAHTCKFPGGGVSDACSSFFYDDARGAVVERRGGRELCLKDQLLNRRLRESSTIVVKQILALVDAGIVVVAGELLGVVSVEVLVAVAERLLFKSFQGKLFPVEMLVGFLLPALQNANSPLGSGLQYVVQDSRSVGIDVAECLMYGVASESVVEEPVPELATYYRLTLFGRMFVIFREYYAVTGIARGEYDTVSDILSYIPIVQLECDLGMVQDYSKDMRCFDYVYEALGERGPMDILDRIKSVRVPEVGALPPVIPYAIVRESDNECDYRSVVAVAYCDPWFGSEVESVWDVPVKPERPIRRPILESDFAAARDNAYEYIRSAIATEDRVRVEYGLRFLNMVHEDEGLENEHLNDAEYMFLRDRVLLSRGGRMSHILYDDLRITEAVDELGRTYVPCGEGGFKVRLSEDRAVGVCAEEASESSGKPDESDPQVSLCADDTIAGDDFADKILTVGDERLPMRVPDTAFCSDTGEMKGMYSTTYIGKDVGVAGTFVKPFQVCACGSDTCHAGEGGCSGGVITVAPWRRLSFKGLMHRAYRALDATPVAEPNMDELFTAMAIRFEGRAVAELVYDPEVDRACNRRMIIAGQSAVGYKGDLVSPHYEFSDYEYANLLVGWRKNGSSAQCIAYGPYILRFSNPSGEEPVVLVMLPGRVLPVSVQLVATFGGVLVYGYKGERVERMLDASALSVLTHGSVYVVYRVGGRTGKMCSVASEVFGHAGYSGFLKLKLPPWVVGAVCVSSVTGKIVGYVGRVGVDWVQVFFFDKRSTKMLEVLIDMEMSGVEDVSW